MYVCGDGENGQLGLGAGSLAAEAFTELPLPFKVARVFCGEAFTALVSGECVYYIKNDKKKTNAYTVESLYYCHSWDPKNCLNWRMAIIEGIK